jgi:hypothetical protein
MVKALLDGPYKAEALVPASPWLDNTAPLPPMVATEKKEDRITINWTHPDQKDVFRWVVYYQYGNAWNYTILNRNELSYELRRTSGEKSVSLNRIVVTAVDRVGNESGQKQVMVTNEY